MNYENHRHNIKSGDLLVWSHRSLKSWYDFKIWLIRLFTQSEYTHVGIAWVYGGRIWVLESVTPYPRIVPLSNLLPCYHTSLPVTWNQEAEDAALALVGREEGKYSELEAVKGFFGANRDPKAWMCVEYCKMILSKCGITFKKRDTPADMVFEAQSLPNSSVTYIE